MTKTCYEMLCRGFFNYTTASQTSRLTPVEKVVKWEESRPRQKIKIAIGQLIQKSEADRIRDIDGSERGTIK